MRKLMTAAAYAALFSGGVAAADEAPITGTEPDLWHSSRFIGTPVFLEDTSLNCRIKDVLFDLKNPTIRGYLVGCGGFVGIGEKEVAFPPSMFTLIVYDRRPALRLTMTESQIMTAKAFGTLPMKERPKQ